MQKYPSRINADFHELDIYSMHTRYSSSLVVSDRWKIEQIGFCDGR